MSSNFPAATRIALLPLLLAVGVGCGRQGDPLPPPSRLPASVQDLAVEQRGEEVRLEFQYPTVTEGGLPLEGVRRVEVWQAVQAWEPPAPSVTPGGEPTATPDIGSEDDPAQEVPTEETPVEPPPVEEPAVEGAPAEDALTAAEPTAAEGAGAAALPRMTPYELAAAAEQIATFEGETLQQAIVGGRIMLSLPRQQLGSVTARELEETAEDEAGDEPADEPEGTDAAVERELLAAHFLAVKTTSPEGKTSALSNPALLIPADPPPPPSDLVATPQENGVELTWRLPPDGELEGSVVYRRGESEERFGAALATLPAGVERLLDGDIQFDRTYSYAVASIGRRQPRVQSALSAETSVRVEDVFPPAPPLRVAAFPATDRVRIIWEASTSNDVAGYRVERRVAEGPFEPLTREPLTAPEYVDTDVRSGGSYVYRVLVLDRSGNVSEPSAEEAVRIP